MILWTKYFKHILVSIVAVTILILGYSLYKENVEKNRLNQELIGTKSEFQKLTNSSALLQINYLSQKELQEKLKTEWSKEKAYLEGRILMLGSSSSTTGGTTVSSSGSQVTTSEYTFNELQFPDGYKLGSIKQYKDGRVENSVYKHRIVSNFAVSRLDDGRYSILSKNALQLVSDPSRVHELDIESGVVYVDPTTASKTKQFYLNNVKFNLGANFSLTNVAPNVSVSLASYGATKNDSQFKLGTIGLNLGEWAVTLVPIFWRPFVQFSNSYLGIGGAIDIDAKTSLFVGIAVGL